MNREFDSISLDTSKTSSDPLVDRTPIIEQLTQLGKVHTLVSFDNTVISPDCEKYSYNHNNHIHNDNITYLFKYIAVWKLAPKNY